uniref:Uncharacterized protein n=1 Tax=Arundo donax TaxID=35708 RepID=A0A0A9AGF4_ARUDO
MSTAFDIKEQQEAVFSFGVMFGRREKELAEIDRLLLRGCHFISAFLLFTAQVLFIPF